MVNAYMSSGFPAGIDPSVDASVAGLVGGYSNGTLGLLGNISITPSPASANR